MRPSAYWNCDAAWHRNTTYRTGCDATVREVISGGKWTAAAGGPWNSVQQTREILSTHRGAWREEVNKTWVKIFFSKLAPFVGQTYCWTFTAAKASLWSCHALLSTLLPQGAQCSSVQGYVCTQDIFGHEMERQTTQERKTCLKHRAPRMFATIIARIGYFLVFPHAQEFIWHNGVFPPHVPLAFYPDQACRLLQSPQPCKVLRTPISPGLS